MKSVGEYHTPETSVSICEIRGRISCARNFCEFREFRGRTSEGGVGMAGCHTLLRKLPQIARMCRFTQNLLAEKRLPRISQIYTETFSKKVLCALRILWEFLYTNLECEICGKQPAHQPNNKHTHQGVQQSLLHQQSKRCNSCSVGTPFSGGAAVSAAPTK